MQLRCPFVFAGTYEVSATDEVGCSGFETAILVNPGPIEDLPSSAAQLTSSPMAASRSRYCPIIPFHGSMVTVLRGHDLAYRPRGRNLCCFN